MRLEAMRTMMLMKRAVDFDRGIVDNTQHRLALIGCAVVEELERHGRPLTEEEAVRMVRAGCNAHNTYPWRICYDGPFKCETKDAEGWYRSDEIFAPPEQGNESCEHTEVGMCYPCTLADMYPEQGDEGVG